MPENDVTTQAAPSAAPSQEQKIQDAYASGKLTPALSRQFQERAMGKEPEPNTEKTAAPDTQEETVESEGKPETAPAPEAGKDKQETSSRRKPSAEQRIAELIAEGKKKDEELERLRKTAKPTQAEPSPAKPAVEAQRVQPLEAPKEPSIDDPKYQGDDGWKLYEADVRKFNRDFAEYSAKKAVAEYQQSELQKIQGEKVAKEFEAANEKHPDYEEVSKPIRDALTAELRAAPEAKTIHPVVLEAIGSNPLCAEILYVLGPETNEFLTLARSNPVAALEKVAVIKHLISEDLAKGAKAENKTEKKVIPAKTETSEPQETREVGSRGTGPSDQAADAVRRANGRLTKEVSDQWARNYAGRQT